MNKIYRKLNKYFSIFKVSVMDRIAYPLELLYANIFILLITLVMSGVWRVVYASQPDKIISGFSLAGMIWYVFMTELILTSNPSIIGEIGEEIKSGNVAYSLTKPYSFVTYYFSSILGKTAINFITKLFIGVLVLICFIKLPSLNLFIIFAVIIAIILALVLNFLVSATCSLLAFWVEDVDSMRFIYQKILFIGGGLLFPLDIYPMFLQKILHYLPFEGILYGPARTFVNFDLVYWQALVVRQTIWIFIFIFLIKIVYAQGIKKVNINGG